VSAVGRILLASGMISAPGIRANKTTSLVSKALVQNPRLWSISSFGNEMRLRILLSAFAFAPNRGSEAGVGWNVATRLAQHHDVTVLCGDLGGRRPAERELAEYFRIHAPIPGLTIQYVPPSRLARAIHWIHAMPGLWFLYYPAYRLWQWDAFAVASVLHAKTPFDLVHQLTYAVYREPGYLWRLPVPFLWGPISGAADPPVSYQRMLGIAGTRFLVRRLGNFIQKRFSFRSVRAARRASLTWVVSDDERTLIEHWGGRAEQQLEVGTSPSHDLPKDHAVGEPLRLIWSGLHIPGKALPLALEALANLGEYPAVHMDVLGAGPMSGAWKRLSLRLHVEHLVTWHGRLPLPDALEVMSKGHVFLHTSLAEATSTVILEALSLGLPVLCHDACGMGIAIDKTCGIKVPLIDPGTSIKGFSQGILDLATNPDLYRQLSRGAVERAGQLTWDNKVRCFNKAYLIAKSPRS
jgi:glycosyltransferase involved in cell wall biosynthesis